MPLSQAACRLSFVLRHFLSYSKVGWGSQNLPPISFSKGFTDKRVPGIAKSPIITASQLTQELSAWHSNATSKTLAIATGYFHTALPDLGSVGAGDGQAADGYNASTLSKRQLEELKRELAQVQTEKFHGLQLAEILRLKVFWI